MAWASDQCAQGGVAQEARLESSHGPVSNAFLSAMHRRPSPTDAQSALLRRQSGQGGTGRPAPRTGPAMWMTSQVEPGTVAAGPGLVSLPDTSTASILLVLHP